MEKPKHLDYLTFARLGFSATLLIQAVLLTITGAALPQTSPERSAEGPPKPTLADARDLLMEGSYDRAIEAYKTLAIDVRHAGEARLGLARCRMQIGQYDEAIRTLTEPAANDSADRDFLLAGLYRLTGRYEKALSHARSAVQRNKDHAVERLLRAETL